MSSQADHGGHRERMRKRFKESGNFKGFSEHEILEMLLFYIVPRKNTNDIAHELIKKFGSLNSVLNASVEELSSVKDMGESSANSLLFFRELINYCSITQTMGRSIHTTVTTVLAMATVCIVCIICGVTSILSFAFPLIIGMISGVYSSNCIAPTLWVHWKKHQAKKSHSGSKTGSAKKKASRR
jgi:NAD-dependent DNA ligase